MIPDRTLLFTAGLAAKLAWRASRRTMFWYLMLTIIMAGVPIVTVWFTKLLFDALSNQSEISSLLSLAGTISALGVGSTVLPQSLHYLRSEIGRVCSIQSKDELFRAVEHFTGLARFEDPVFLDQLRLAQQATRSPGTLIDSGLSLVRNLLTSIGLLGSLYVLHPLLAMITLAAAVPMLLAELALSRRRAGVLWEISPVERREFFYARLLGTIEAAKEIRLFGTAPFLRRRLLDEHRASMTTRRVMDLREMRVQAAYGLLGALVAGGGLIWTVLAAAGGQLSIGDVSMVVAAIAALQAALVSLVTDVARGHQELIFFSHFSAIVRTSSDLAATSSIQRTPRLQRGIELRNVWFRYADDQPWILRGVNLFIPHRSTTALVGLNGAGKSTLVKLLCRFYDPTKGSILWDGVDLRSLSVAELRQRIGAVFQDYMHYDLTAAENIALGDLTALDDRPRQQKAAQRAGIHEKVASLPHGYDTLLSRMFVSETDKEDTHSGVILSDGQWQRLALARAFLRDHCDLMILDEPSSGLDAEAESKIHSQITRQRSGKTSLLISHRLGAVRDADLIATLEGGQIVELGSHDELIKSDGPYARLFQLQAEGYLPS